MDSQQIIVLYGPPCSGKTTIGLLLSKTLNLAFLSTDQLREEFPALAAFTDENNETVFITFLDRLRDYCKTGQSAVCEGFFYSQERKEQLLQIAGTVPVYFVLLTAEIGILQQRLAYRNRSTTKYLKPARNGLLSQAKLEDYYGRFKACHYTRVAIDTALFSPARTVELLKRIKCRSIRRLIK